MSRPIKTGIDYFPLDVDTDDKIELLEAKHGIKGFGIIIKLLQRIYKNGYWYQWEEKELLLFSKRINVDRNEVSDVIKSSFELGILSETLFTQHKILTSQGIQKRYFAAIGRRAKIEIMPDYLLIDVSAYDNVINVCNNSINTHSGTQTKLKETKLNKTTEDYGVIFDSYNGSLNLKYEDYKEWIEYRIEKKKPLTVKSIKQQLMFLSKQPDPVECINQSIRNGWQGIFEVKNNGTNREVRERGRGAINTDVVRSEYNSVKKRDT